MRIKSYLVLLFVLAAFSGLKSQYSAIAYGSYYQFLKGNRVDAFGGGFKLGYEFEANTMALAGMNFFGTVLDGHLTSATAIDTSTVPYKVPVGFNQEIKLNDVFIEGRYCFLGHWRSKANLFGVAGGGLAFIAQTERITGTFNEDLYALDIVPDVQRILAQGTVYLGLGAEYKIGPGHLFGEGKVFIPLEQPQGTAIITEVPWTLLGKVGYRIYFGAELLPEQGSKDESRDELEDEQQIHHNILPVP